MQSFAGGNFDEQRREVLTKVLGEEGADSVKLPSLNSAAVNLTGPVLGALPPETWNSVQEICARSMIADKPIKWRGSTKMERSTTLKWPSCATRRGRN